MAPSNQYWMPNVPTPSGGGIPEWIRCVKAGLLHIWAPWVGYDRDAAERLHMAANVTTVQGNEAVVAACRFDAEQNFAFLGAERITTVPSVIAYRYGKEFERIEGLADQAEYERLILRILQDL